MTKRQAPAGLARRCVRAMASVLVAAGVLGGMAAGPLTQAGAARTPATILIGDICSCTGPEASSIAQTSTVVEAWASWVDAKGGLDGHQVKVIVKNDGYSPSTSITDAKELVQQDHVIALFDNSDESPSWTAYVKQEKVPVLGGQDTTAGYDNTDFFVPGATFNYFNAAGAAAAKARGVKKVADLYCVEVAICAQATAGAKAADAKVGIQTTYSTAISFAAPNYTAQCLAAKESGATAMVVGDASSIVVKVAETCAVQGYTPRELSGDGTVAISWLTVPAMQGNVDTQSNLPWFVHDGATKDMYAALDRYAQAVPKSPDFGEIVVQAWSAGALLQAAVAAGHLTPQPTSAEITAGLYALPTDTTLGGLSAPLHFAKGRPSANSCFYLMGIENKKFVTLDHGTYDCATK
jgi:branched-chain amino acid transport system substrate-binding protein